MWMIGLSSKVTPGRRGEDFKGESNPWAQTHSRVLRDAGTFSWRNASLRDATSEPGGVPERLVMDRSVPE